MNFNYKGDNFCNRYINTEDKMRYIDYGNIGIKVRHTYTNNSTGYSRGYGSNNNGLIYLYKTMIKLLKE